MGQVRQPARPQTEVTLAMRYIRAPGVGKGIFTMCDIVTVIKERQEGQIMLEPGEARGTNGIINAFNLVL